MNTKRYKIIITGKVQGVGYRYFAVNNAIALKLTGFVQNQYDGSVVAEAEGSENDLDLFLKVLEQGPFYSRVDKVHKVEMPVRGDRGFVVK